LEREIQQACFEVGRKALRAALEEWDRSLMEQRDKTVYRHVGKKRTTIKTVIGEVTYQRTQYEYIDEGGDRCYIFMLDEAMGLESTGHFSELMRELIVQASCAGPYREAARTVSEMTGQAISHTAAWNVVQAVGQQVDKQEQRASKLAAENKGGGTIEAKVVFEEQDGIYLNLQGKSRVKHGSNKEMKVAIAYDGAVEVGRNRYRLTNKVASASFEKVEEFVKRKEGIIASVYNVDEIEMRLLNGDGAVWIRQSQTDETVHFQLDQMHRNKAVIRYVSNLESRAYIFKALRMNDPDIVLSVIDTEMRSTDDEEAKENYANLYKYFENNRDGLVPYYKRGLDIPAPPEGKVYRGMGAMESNIFTIIGNRMKGGRANWSIEGGENLARLLCLKHTGKLKEILNTLDNSILSERYAEEIVVKMTAAKVPLHVGKGYNGYKQAMIPASLQWLKDLGAIKPL